MKFRNIERFQSSGQIGNLENLGTRHLRVIDRLLGRLPAEALASIQSLDIRGFDLRTASISLEDMLWINTFQLRNKPNGLLIGMLVYYLAWSILSESDRQDVDSSVYELAIEWGFEKEIQSYYSWLGIPFDTGDTSAAPN